MQCGAYRIFLPPPLRCFLCQRETNTAIHLIFLLSLHFLQILDLLIEVMCTFHQLNAILELETKSMHWLRQEIHFDYNFLLAAVFSAFNIRETDHGLPLHLNSNVGNYQGLFIVSVRWNVKQMGEGR